MGALRKQGFFDQARFSVALKGTMLNEPGQVAIMCQLPLACQYKIGMYHYANTLSKT